MPAFGDTEAAGNLYTELQACLEFLEEATERGWADGHLLEAAQRRVGLLHNFIAVPILVRGSDGVSHGEIAPSSQIPEPMLEEVAGVVRQISTAVGAKDDEQFENLVTHLDSMVHVWLSALAGDMANWREPARGDALRHLYRFRDEYDLAKASGEVRRLSRDAEHVRAAAERADDVVASIEEAAGQAATSELAAEFERYYQRERFRADGLRLMTILLLAGIVVLAAIFANADLDFTWMLVVRKALVAIPLGVLAAYLAREARDHQMQAAWAGIRSTQLKTLRAYTEGLDPVQRQELRLEFGRVVFARDLPLPVRAAAVEGEDVVKGVASAIQGIVKA